VVGAETKRNCRGGPKKSGRTERVGDEKGKKVRNAHAARQKTALRLGDGRFQSALLDAKKGDGKRTSRIPVGEQRQKKFLVKLREGKRKEK